MEIAGPESQTRGRVHTFAECERGGDPEYRLLDPDRRTAKSDRRGPNGKDKPMPIDKAGVWIDVEWRRPPSAVELLKARGVV